MKKIAIQGTLGSYHDIAAHKYFEGEEIQLICCASFEDGVAGAHGRRGAGGGAQRAVSGLPISGYGAQRPVPRPGRALPDRKSVV